MAMSSQAQKTKPFPVIFDSDMGPDYDDVGAIAMLHAFADSGYIKILATVASTKYEGVAAVFNVLNTYFKRPGLLIGVPGSKALELKDSQHWTDTLLLNYPHKIKKNNEVLSAIEVYRKSLASQPDGSVTIITVGFLTNLADLLQSAPDKYSKLTGKELVRKKVKRLVCMAGSFPAGNEFNVRMDAAASTIVFENWETPMSPQDSAGRMSWDETAVLIAVKGYKPWWNIQTGKIKIAEDGSNTWENGSSPHSYLVESQSPILISDRINKLIMHQPGKVKK